jgi:hypothetical protein
MVQDSNPQHGSTLAEIEEPAKVWKQTSLMISATFQKVVVAAALLVPAPAWCADIAVLHNGFAIRCESRQQVGSVTRLYLGSGGTGFVDVPSVSIDHFERDLTPVPSTPTAASVAAPVAIPVSTPLPTPNTPVRLDQVVSDASGRHHIDPDLISSVIHAESDFNPRAVSPKGARGLMQLMPQTASQLGVHNAFDPKANVEGGTLYLRTLLEQYNFEVVKALAASNAGPQRVARYKGVPPYYETQAYVARIIRDFNRKKLAEQRAAAAAKATSHKLQTTAKAGTAVATKQTLVQ